MRLHTGVLLILMVVAGNAPSQFRLPGVKVPDIPGVDSIFKKGPAITTSLKDAKWEAKDKDSFNPDCKPMSLLKRTADGGFILEPGAWEATLQSY